MFQPRFLPSFPRQLLLFGFLCFGWSAAAAADWPMWGGQPSRNMVAAGKNPPTNFAPGKKIRGSDEIDLATTKGLKWTVLLGSQAYGTPVVSGGRIILGTNNENPRDPRITEDRSVVLCLDEKTGTMLWQVPCRKLPTGKINDYEFVGMSSSFAVAEDRVYLPTNRCEVLCLDLQGLKNGNQGSQDEVAYYSSKAQAIASTQETDGDIIWKFDMIAEVGAQPHNQTTSSVLLYGDRVYAATSNGVDWTHANTPAPQAPALICLDRATGKLLAQEASGIGTRLLHASWSSPAAVLGEHPQIIYGGGDGFCYGFDLGFAQKEAKGAVLKELWRCDANDQRSRNDEHGNPLPYASNTLSPSEIIATPVVYNQHIYTVVGQDPEHLDGPGCLTCIDLKGRPIWRYQELTRSMSTPSIADGIVYVADFHGRVHSVDAATGAKLWVYETKGHIWRGTLLIDGLLYVGNEEGELHIIQASRAGGKRIKMIEFPAPIYTSPVYAQDTLFVMTTNRLYAFGASAE